MASYRHPWILFTRDDLNIVEAGGFPSHENDLTYDKVHFTDPDSDTESSLGQLCHVEQVYPGEQIYRD